MLRHCVFASTIALLCVPALAATSLYSDLYGKNCRAVDSDAGSGASTRLCRGVAGYHLLVHEANGQTSVDIVTPKNSVWPLEYWEVVTPGLSSVGRMAEWRMEVRNGKPVPVALLVRLDIRAPALSGPRIAGSEGLITAARIERDGACVVFQGSGHARTADAEARAAAADRTRKCLGVYSAGPVAAE